MNHLPKGISNTLPFPSRTLLTLYSHSDSHSTAARFPIHYLAIFSVTCYPPLHLISFFTNLESKLSPLWDFFCSLASVLLLCAQAAKFGQRKITHSACFHFLDSKPQTSMSMQHCPASLHFPNHCAFSISETTISHFSL